jgi:hypothetical protein
VTFHVPNERRVRRGTGASSEADGNNGWFVMDSPKQRGRRLLIVASDGLGWEHVSVHASEGPDRSMTPTWAEMCFVKDVFWDDEDVVMQLHPRKSEYVNFHAHTLHLWRPTDQTIPTPHHLLVGPRA